MKHAITPCVLALSLLLASWSFGATVEDPLSFLPSPDQEESLAYLEINDISLLSRVIESKWFKDIIVNLGELKEKDVIMLNLISSSLKTFVREASAAVYLKVPKIAEINKEPPKVKAFLILKTAHNPIEIIRALNIEIVKEGTLYRIASGNQGLYLYTGENYAILGDEDLKRILSPTKIASVKIMKRKGTNIVPNHERSGLYIYVKTPEASFEAMGRDEGKSFTVKTRLLELKPPFKETPMSNQPMTVAIPGRGNITLLGALPLDGRLILSAMKETLSQEEYTQFKRWISENLHISDEELFKLLTGRLYLVLGGECRILETPLPGLYLYYISDTKEEESSILMGKIIEALKANMGEWLRFERRPGWDLSCFLESPIMDLFIGSKGKEVLLGLVSFESLGSYMVLPSHLNEALRETKLPFLYLNIANLTSLYDQITKILMALEPEDKEFERNAKQLRLIIPPWKEMLFIMRDQRNGEIRISY